MLFLSWVSTSCTRHPTLSLWVLPKICVVHQQAKPRIEKHKTVQTGPRQIGFNEASSKFIFESLNLHFIMNQQLLSVILLHVQHYLILQAELGMT